MSWRDKDPYRCAVQLQGRKLRRVRWEHGMAITELAARSGVDKNTISDLENDKHRVYSVTIKKLATAFGMTPQEFAREFYRDPAMEDDDAA